MGMRIKRVNQRGSVETSASDDKVVKKRRYMSREKWAVLVGEAARCSESVQKFCAKRDINENCFYKWRRKLKKECGAGKNAKFAPVRYGGIAKESAFVPVKILAAADLPKPLPASPALTATASVSQSILQISSRFILHGKNGVRIEFPCGCTGSELKLVAEVLAC
jgi:transposase-like protein